MKGIAESVIALQALKNGNLLMTVKKDVYIKPLGNKVSNEVSCKLNQALTTGVVSDSISDYKEMVEACKVSNMVTTFECDVTYDDFFSSIKSILTKAEYFDESEINSFNSGELWAAINCSKGRNNPQPSSDTRLNVLLGNVIPEEHLDSFRPVLFG